VLEACVVVDRVIALTNRVILAAHDQQFAPARPSIVPPGAVKSSAVVRRLRVPIEARGIVPAGTGAPITYDVKTV
jgi:hypothetical protein